MSYHIYCYANKHNNKLYIGQTVDLKRRDSEHTLGHSSNKSLIDKSIKKYGRNNFELWTICIVQTVEEANQEEIFWIAEMRKQLGRDMIYNLTDGGGGTTSRLVSKETRHKISISRIGKTASAEAKMKMSKSKIGNHNSLGNKRSDQSKKKQSLAQIGRIFSPETRVKISQSLTGRVISLETKLKSGADKKGKTWKLINGKRVWLSKTET